jgi:hypothetical protein
VAADLGGTRKTSDGIDLQVDDDGQHFPDSRKALEQLHPGGDGDLASDTILEGSELQRQAIEQLQVLRLQSLALCFLRKRECNGIHVKARKGGKNFKKWPNAWIPTFQFSWKFSWRLQASIQKAIKRV